MFENFPYTNFHEMNMDWIIKVVKDFLEKYTHIQETIQEGLDDLDQKAAHLQELLQSWYDTHSEDIEQELITAINEFNQAAEQKAAQTIASIPSDYTELSNLVNYLNNELKATNENFDDLFIENNYAIKYPNKRAIFTDGGYINPLTGDVSEHGSYCYSDYVPIKAATFYTFSGVGTCYGAYYNSNNEYISPAVRIDEPTGTFSTASTSPNDAAYLRISIFIVNKNTLKVEAPNIPLLFNSDCKIRDTNSSNDFRVNGGVALKGVTIGKNHFDKNDEVTGKYILLTLAPTLNDAYNYTLLKHMKENTSYIISGTDQDFIISFFDSEENNLGYVTTHSFTTPANTSIVAFSYRVSGGNRKDTIMIEEGSSPTQYEGFNYRLNNKHIYIVDKNGNGDYTSFTECVLEAVKYPNSYIYVNQGIYNIINEWNALFGSNFLDNYTVESRFFGIPIGNGITIECAWNARLTAVYTGSNQTAQHEVALFNAMDSDFTLIGVNAYSSALRYCIHDDLQHSTKFYKHVYKNCRLNHNKNNGAGYIQTIGGGFSKNCIIIVEDCIIQSEGTTTDPILSFHNTPLNYAQSQLIVKDSYIFGTVRVSWYGESTYASTALISNCKLKAQPFASAETEASTTVNVSLIAWNNEIS